MDEFRRTQLELASALAEQGTIDARGIRELFQEDTQETHDCPYGDNAVGPNLRV